VINTIYCRCGYGETALYKLKDYLIKAKGQYKRVTLVLDRKKYFMSIMEQISKIDFVVFEE
jgi:hypothetical protein